MFKHSVQIWVRVRNLPSWGKLFLGDRGAAFLPTFPPVESPLFPEPKTSMNFPYYTLKTISYAIYPHRGEVIDCPDLLL